MELVTEFDFTLEAIPWISCSLQTLHESYAGKGVSDHSRLFPEGENKN